MAHKEKYTREQLGAMVGHYDRNKEVLNWLVLYAVLGIILR